MQNVPSSASQVATPNGELVPDSSGAVYQQQPHHPYSYHGAATGHPQSSYAGGGGVHGSAAYNTFQHRHHQYNHGSNSSNHHHHHHHNNNNNNNAEYAYHHHQQQQQQPQPQPHHHHQPVYAPTTSQNTAAVKNYNNAAATTTSTSAATTTTTNNNNNNNNNSYASANASPQRPVDMNQLAQLIAIALHYRCEADKDYDRSEGCVNTAFHSNRVPPISVWDYVKRIDKYAACSPECFVIAFIVIDRYCAVTRIPVTFRNIHRLAITACLVGVKLRDDIFHNNKYYANIGGVTPLEMNYLERELLATIGWHTWIEPSEYYEYLARIKEQYGSLLPGQPVLH